MLRTHFLILSVALSFVFSISAQAGGALGLLAGILGVPHFPESDLYTTDDDIVITGADGTEIQANIFIPTTNKSSYPAIIFINSWALNEYQYLAQAAKFAEKGYIVLNYETRGFGKSGGEVDTAGPNDMQDLSAVVDWLLANTDTDVNNIGVSGISYGSGIALLGLAHEPRLKTAISMSTWGDLVQSLYGNQTPRLIWGGLLTLSGEITGNLNPEVKEKYSNLLLNNDVEGTIDWGNVRSPVTYIDVINARHAPIYIANNFGDNLFQPNQVLEFYRQLTVPKRIDLNQGTHASAEIGGLMGLENYTWDNAHQWFDHWLKGEANGIMDKAPVSMEVKFEDERDDFNSWPLPNISEDRLYFHERGMLSEGGLKSYPYAPWWSKTDTFYSGIDTIATTGIPLLSYFLEAEINTAVTTSIPLISDLNAIAYQTSFLSDEVQLRGIPKIHLEFKPSKSKGLIMAYLYDVNAIGIGKLITHAPYTFRDATLGKSTSLDMDMVATAYNVPAGHRIALVLDTADLLYSPPTILPQSVKVNYSYSKQSYIDLPVK